MLPDDNTSQTPLSTTHPPNPPADLINDQMVGTTNTPAPGNVRDTNAVSDHDLAAPLPPPSAGAGLQKEKELLAKHDEKLIEELGREIELEKEVQEAGVEKIGEEIILPEPVKKEDVKIVGPGTPLEPMAPSLPLNQKQIKIALHQKITEAIRWLAVWCLRQLKLSDKSKPKPEI